ncbi:unnamed protein product [Mycetohabitans rhizoxinica HKI 454]|uniref:Uncharacterized protein n=1 Tax=Mycetohabitans rhizoxinica (strain DSM 19002 / CIP 109453 / HKI 454) TaxID=882378 RepID=E5AKK5_MYCRK|nr:unnamed protein product [Mycetohabitans rhizoxinica HKI 454]
MERPSDAHFAEIGLCVGSIQIILQIKDLEK